MELTKFEQLIERLRAVFGEHKSEMCVAFAAGVAVGMFFA